METIERVPLTKTTFKPTSAIGAYNLGLVLKMYGIYSQPSPKVEFVIYDDVTADLIANEVKKRNLFVEVTKTKRLPSKRSLGTLVVKKL